MNLVSADEAAAAEVDHEVTEEVVVLLAARAQEQAREHADRGEFDAARKLLGEAAKELREMAPKASTPEELLAHAETLEQNLRWMEQASYSPTERKMMSYQLRQSRQRRKRPKL